MPSNKNTELKAINKQEYFIKSKFQSSEQYKFISECITNIALMNKIYILCKIGLKWSQSSF